LVEKKRQKKNGEERGWARHPILSRCEKKKKRVIPAPDIVGKEKLKRKKGDSDNFIRSMVGEKKLSRFRGGKGKRVDTEHKSRQFIGKDPNNRNSWRFEGRTKGEKKGDHLLLCAKKRYKILVLELYQRRGKKIASEKKKRKKGSATDVATMG